jgi:hypothetical protein
MKNSDVQDIDTGRNRENKKKPSFLESSPMMNVPDEIKVQEGEPSKKSSTLTQTKKTVKNMSENELVSGSEITPKKPRKNQMPVPKSDPKRAEQALQRLKIKPEILAATPQISPTIKSCVKGGFKTALDAMRFSVDDQDIATFLRKYDSIPIGDRNHLSWEAIAIAAKVNTKHLIGSILLAVSQHCATKSKFIVASNHPMITQKRVEFAQMIGGEKDRSALDIMAGAQQGQSGHTFIQKAWFNPSAAKEKDEEEVSKPTATYEETTGGFDDLFPSPNEVQDKLVPIRQRLLEK